jgi:hypothetical protein
MTVVASCSQANERGLCASQMQGRGRSAREEAEDLGGRQWEGSNGALSSARGFIASRRAGGWEPSGETPFSHRNGMDLGGYLKLGALVGSC